MKFIRSIWNKLSLSGVNDHQHFQTQQRIILSNQLGIVIFLVGLFFVFRNVLTGNFNIIAFLCISILGMIIIVLNQFNQNTISRWLVCVGPGIAITTINLLLKINSPEIVEIIHYISPRMVVVSSVVLPFILFSVDELKVLLFSIGIIVLNIFLYDPMHKFLGITHINLGFESAFYNLVYENIIVSLIILLSSSAFTLLLSKKTADRNQNLIDQFNEKNTQMESREKELEKMLTEVERAREEDKKRSWATKGLADVSKIMQSNDEIQSIYDQLISNIVTYIEANQGGLYVVDEDENNETIIELSACYAYNRKKFVEKTINPGQGLLGQTFLEGNTVYLKNIPNNYVSITSGLGEANPTTLLIVPLKNNDKIEALIELASFNDIEDYKIDFLEKMGETVASTISSIKTDKKTKILLEQSQINTEELRAQEEEMRQNMEELQATQEEMARKEQEYLDKIEQLESQNN